MNVPLIYFHRYLRLTPLFVVTILCSMSLLRYLGNGPIWPLLLDFLNGQCERNYWSTLLYIQNYVNPLDVVSEFDVRLFERSLFSFFILC